MSSSSPSNLPTDFPERKTEQMTGLGTALPAASSGALTGTGTDLGERSTGSMTGAPTSSPGLDAPPGAAVSPSARSGSVTGVPTSTPGRTSLGQVNPDAPTAIATAKGAGAAIAGDETTAQATDGAGPRAAPRPGEGPRGRSRIGLYEVMEELGRGGMGAVYRAWHPMRRKYVALKVIKPDVATGDKLGRLKELFLREGGILMSIAHENVVGCYDANEADHEGKPVLYMALELLEGESLQERLGKGPLTLKEAGEVTRSLARALRALHENKQRILHRDLKPANAFLCKDGGVKLLDFGLAGVADWKLTQVSMFAAGSRPYMPPEQFDGLRLCTERSDLYSLGCALFQMVTGKTPFSADTDNGFMRAHREKSPPLLVEMLPSLAEGKDPLLEPIQNITTKLLAKRPDERYASAAELVAALDTALGGGTILPPKVTRPETVRLRNRILTAIATVVLAAAFSLGAIAYVQSGSAGKVSEARRRLEAARLDQAAGKLDDAARKLDDAGRLVVEVLTNDRDNEAAKKLEREIGDARGAAVDAAAEADRARSFAARADAADSALATAIAAAVERGVPLDRGPIEAAIRDAEKVRRLDRVTEVNRVADLVARLGGAASLARARVELTAARAELERGARPEARGRLEALAREMAIPPEVAGPHKALLDDLAAAEGVALDWSLARDHSERRNHDAAAERAAAVRDALRAGGPVLEARAGVTAQEAAELHARSQKGNAVARLKAAVAAQPVSLDAIRGALAPAESEGAATSDRALVERARRLLYDDAMDRAKKKIAPGGAAAEARDAALDALRALSLEEAAGFKKLAVAFGEDVAKRGAPIARDALRLALRGKEHAAAEGAWLILESAEARLGVDSVREGLFERIEGVRLGMDAGPWKKVNPRHLATLAPFYLDRDEVSVAAYAAAVRAKRVPAPETWVGGAPPAGAEAQPVVGVLADHAALFAAGESPPRRLPLADEWELAASFVPARPERPRTFAFGEQWDARILNPDASEGAVRPPPIGALELDRVPWGGRGLASGANEWVMERDAGGTPRAVLMGACWVETNESYFHAGRRFRPSVSARPEERADVIRFFGFRCARDAPAPDLSEFAR